MPKAQSAAAGHHPRNSANHEDLHSPHFGRCGKAESLASPKDASWIEHGTAEMLRAEIFDAARMAAAQADIVAQYAELRNDAGLEHGILCLIGFTRSAAATLVDLKAMKARQTEEAGHGRQ